MVFDETVAFVGEAMRLGELRVLSITDSPESTPERYRALVRFPGLLHKCSSSHRASKCQADYVVASWDAWALRPPLPPWRHANLTERLLASPMNVMHAEQMARCAFMHEGLAVINACRRVRMFDWHCGPKTSHAAGTFETYTGFSADPDEESEICRPLVGNPSRKVARHAHKFWDASQFD